MQLGALFFAGLREHRGKQWTTEELRGELAELKFQAQFSKYLKTEFSDRFVMLGSPVVRFTLVFWLWVPFIKQPTQKRVPFVLNMVAGLPRMPCLRDLGATSPCEVESGMVIRLTLERSQAGFWLSIQLRYVDTRRSVAPFCGCQDFVFWYKPSNDVTTTWNHNFRGRIANEELVGRQSFRFMEPCTQGTPHSGVWPDALVVSHFGSVDADTTSTPGLSIQGRTL